MTQEQEIELAPPVAARTATRPADEQVPSPAAPSVPAAGAGGALAGVSVPPPPAAAYGLLVAALALAAVYFSSLLTLPTHRTSAPFISLLERPG
jgi:hypothetical protein